MRAVNLLPRQQPRRQHKRMPLGTQVLIVAPLVLGAVLAAGHLVGSSKVNDRKATLQALRDELAALPATKTQTPGDDQLAAQHELRVEALAGALRSRVAWDRILRQISSVLPEDVWLITLTAQSPEAPAGTQEVVAPPTTSISSPLTGGEAAPVTGGGPTVPSVAAAAPLVINGYTYSQEGVARFLGRLAVIPELTDVKLEKSENSTVSDRIVVRFTIQASIRSQGVAGS